MLLSRPAVGVGLLFASNGAVFAAVLPWYPLVSGRLHLSGTWFGVAVACCAVGAIISSALPAWLISRFGPVAVSVAGTVVLAGAVWSAGMSSSAWWFAGSLFVAGFADAVVDVAQNVAGVRVQDQANRPILSSMHALWSLGGAASGAASAGAVAAGIAPEWFLAATALISVVLVAYGGWLVQPTLKQNVPPVTQPSEAQSNSQRTPWRAVIGVALPLVVVAVCGTAVEDIANNWAALSGAQLAGMSSAAGVVFAIVIASQCLGRFLGDVLVHRFSRVRVATWGGLCIAAGGCIVVLTHQPAILCAGFATAGWGCATLVPSALNAAARLPGISQQAGVTVVSWLMRIGFLATSPIIGVMADHINLRAGLGLLIPLGLTTALLSQRLAQ